LLQAWRGGDQEALDRLIPLVHQELHRLAHIYMRCERGDHTLQTTALVNEAYLRLVGANKVDWQDRAHFFAIAANLMRRILVDFARAGCGGKGARKGATREQRSYGQDRAPIPAHGKDRDGGYG
jgi:RNA polymerase sigma factor (TIGR02999 family)